MASTLVFGFPQDWQKVQKCFELGAKGSQSITFMLFLRARDEGSSNVDVDLESWPEVELVAQLKSS